MAQFPTGFTDKGFADSTDKVWASDGATNFNITVDEIGDENFSNRSTSDLPEGTNLYHTDSRVTNATQVQQNISDIADRELLSNKSTNTSLGNSDTLYPTQNAVKEYVDNKGIPINSQTEETTIEDDDEVVFYDVSADSNKKITKENLLERPSSTLTSYTAATASSGVKAVTTSHQCSNYAIINIVYDFSRPTLNTGTLEVSTDGVVWVTKKTLRDTNSGVGGGANNFGISCFTYTSTPGEYVRAGVLTSDQSNYPASIEITIQD